ncbi:MAG: mannose-1-phosphate guanylyltransferase [Planctomycetes bacterium]|nr:mannose-1-phosphate guanylyltransferase [Planctomycetota bacterium]
MRHVVILAGGGGTRFWPLSTPERPKQFLRLFGRRTLLADTVARCRGLVPPSRTWVVTNAAHVALTRREAPTIPARQILGEPVGRNSAAAMALAARVIGEIDPAATLLFLPADAHIPDAAAFRDTARVALDFAEAPRTFVTLGITPTFPATGYGYLVPVPGPGPSLRPPSRPPAASEGYSGPRGKGAADARGLASMAVVSEGCAGPRVSNMASPRGPQRSRSQALPLARFVEKPVASKARRLLRAGARWNAGIFAGRADAFDEAFEEFLPPVARGMVAAGREWRRGEKLLARGLRAAYAPLPSISIDYAVMEPASRSRDWHLLTVPGRFAWSDVGTWRALRDLMTLDPDGNAVRGSHEGHSRDCLLMATRGSHVSVSGVHDLAVISSPRATLVARLSEAERVREIPEALARGRGRRAGAGLHVGVDTVGCRVEANRSHVVGTLGVRDLKIRVTSKGAEVSG